MRMIGKLIYLTNTRPNITHAVNFLSHFLHNPIKRHRKAVQRILHYLKVAQSLGIFFSSDNDISLKAFSDSDWATWP